MDDFQIKLDDYLLVVNDDGTAYQEDPEFVLIQHKTTQEVVKAERSAVAEYYGLTVVEPPPNFENSSGEAITLPPPSNNLLPPPNFENSSGEAITLPPPSNNLVPPPNFENSSGEEITLPPPSNNSVIPSGDNADEITSPRQFMCWNEGETKLMLALYQEYMAQIGPLKKLKNKKELWKTIQKTMKCKLGSDFTETQIENRFKTISRRHKKTIDNNHTTGASRIVPAFEKEFQSIAALDDSLEPEVMMDTTSIYVKTPSNVRQLSASPLASDSEQSGPPTPTAGPSTATAGSSTPTTSRRSKQADIQAQMLEAFQESQKEKTRRHNERMQKVDSITALLTRIAEKP